MFFLYIPKTLETRTGFCKDSVWFSFSVSLQYVPRMKEKLQDAASTLAKYDEKLIDLHGQGVLDGFTFPFLSFI